MDKEAYSPDRTYTQGWHDALASLSIGASTYDRMASLIVASYDKHTGVITILAQATVRPDSGAIVTL